MLQPPWLPEGQFWSMFHLVSQKVPTGIKLPLTGTYFWVFSLLWPTSPTSFSVPPGSLPHSYICTQVLLWGKPPPLNISEGMAAQPLSRTKPETPRILTLLPCGLSAPAPWRQTHRWAGGGSKESLGYVQRQKVEAGGTCRVYPRFASILIEIAPRKWLQWPTIKKIKLKKPTKKHLTLTLRCDQALRTL